MTAPSASTWVSALPRTMEQFSIVFLQFGHASDDFRAQVEELPGRHISARAFLSNDDETQESWIFVDRMEELAVGRGDQLGPLRERIMREAASGHYFALISRSPKTAFPDTVGSDVVSDAKQLFPTLSVESVHDDDPEEHLRHCVSELGDRTLLALSTALWESQLAPLDALAALSKPDLEALRGARLVATNDNAASWSNPGGFRDLRRAVALVSAETVMSRAAVPDTFSELWRLERMLRNMVRRALVERMMDAWRESCLDGELAKSVIERAQRIRSPARIDCQIFAIRLSG